jgi:hypothetical protein
MTRLPYPKHKDTGGHTFYTVDGVRYRIPGTAHEIPALRKLIKDGRAEIVEGNE